MYIFPFRVLFSMKQLPIPFCKNINERKCKTYLIFLTIREEIESIKKVLTSCKKMHIHSPSIVMVKLMIMWKMNPFHSQSLFDFL